MSWSYVDHIRPPLSHLPLRKFHGFAADALQDARCRAARVCHDRGAGLSPCARNTIREAISRDTPSSQHAGHPVRRNCTHSAAGTFSGHRRRSRRTCHQRCGWPSLSGDERRSRGVCVITRRWTSRVARGRGRAGSRREARRSWVLVVVDDDVRPVLRNRRRRHTTCASQCTTGTGWVGRNARETRPCARNA